MAYALFGPGGNGELFKRLGMKNSAEAPIYTASAGLDAYEYECGRGVPKTPAVFKTLGENARANGIRLSVHAPYFISLSSEEEAKRVNSIAYIGETVACAELMGADTIVIHSGSCAGRDRREAMALSMDTLRRTAETFAGSSVRFGIETMGKINQLGTLDEVIEQCRVSPLFTPVVDFGHLNARELGAAFRTADDYRRVFDTIAHDLGDGHAKNLHCHFSKIEYTNAGEKRHLTFEDTVFGPSFEPLAEAIVKEGVTPRIICESDGTQPEDALYMKKTYLSLLG